MRTIRALRARGRRIYAVGLNVALLVLAEAVIRTRSLPEVAVRFRTPLDTSSRALTSRPPDLALLPSSVRLRLRVLEDVLRHWPAGGDGKCLRRSLVAGHHLHDLFPRLRVGVRSEDGRVSAHAWLEVSGHALDAEATRYAVLLDVEHQEHQ